MTDKEQFYPTPKDVARKLVKLLKLDTDGLILEPSAGTGALVQALTESHAYIRQRIHCMEIHPERRAVLKEKDYAVVWDDFLTCDPLMPYSAILMNPPFRDGCRHLMKALCLCVPGGEIACILNAETIKNPCTTERKALIAALEAQEKYTVDFMESAFADAERPTNVEVALIYVRTKQAEPKRSVTFDHYVRWIAEERAAIGEECTLVHFGEVPAMIDRCRAEIMAGTSLYDEILAYNRISVEGIAEPYRSDSVFDVKVNGSHTNSDRADIVRHITYKYWKKLLYSQELSHLLTSDAQNQYAAKLQEMADYEFSERNILQLKEELCRDLISNLDAAILKVWEEFTSKYSYTDYSANIHYYNGWKTNKAYKVNKKVIIPLYAFDTYDGRFNPSYRVASQLSDIEKAMNYLDCGRTEDADMFRRLSEAQQTGQNRNIDTKYFTVTLYKKGTCHLIFKDEGLLKKFNLYCGRRKNWLPDDYGRKPYSHLDAEEKAVADSFEGKDNYEETFKNQSFYLAGMDEILRLPSRVA